MQEILAQAWEEYSPRWRRYAMSLVRDPVKADEIVQEAVMRTLRANPRFDELADAHFYVRRAIFSSAVNTWKDESAVSELDDRELSPADDPQQAMVRAQRRATDHRMAGRMLTALESLSKAKQRAIRMRYLDRPPKRLREIAALEGKAISTVHSRIRSGMHELAAVLKEDDDAS